MAGPGATPSLWRLREPPCASRLGDVVAKRTPFLPGRPAGAGDQRCTDRQTDKPVVETVASASGKTARHFRGTQRRLYPAGVAGSSALKDEEALALQEGLGRAQNLPEQSRSSGPVCTPSVIQPSLELGFLQLRRCYSKALHTGSPSLTLRRGNTGRSLKALPLPPGHLTGNPAYR